MGISRSGNNRAAFSGNSRLAWWSVRTKQKLVHAGFQTQHILLSKYGRFIETLKKITSNRCVGMSRIYEYRALQSQNSKVQCDPIFNINENRGSMDL